MATTHGPHLNTSIHSPPLKWKQCQGARDVTCLKPQVCFFYFYFSILLAIFYLGYVHANANTQHLFTSSPTYTDPYDTSAAIVTSWGLSRSSVTRISPISFQDHYAVFRVSEQLYMIFQIRTRKPAFLYLFTVFCILLQSISLLLINIVILFVIGCNYEA